MYAVGWTLGKSPFGLGRIVLFETDFTLICSINTLFFIFCVRQELS